MEAVEDRGSSDRIEIELTSRDDAVRRRWGRGGDQPPPVIVPELAEPTLERTEEGSAERPTTVDPTDVAYSPPIAPDAGPLSTERRRLIVTGLAAAVVALFLGWAFGRAGGPGSTATDTDASTTIAVTTTTTPGDELGATVPLVDPDLLPTTTDASPVVRTNPDPPTTTSPPGWTLSSARVDPRAAALDVRIVGAQHGGRLVELDTGSGELAGIDTSLRFSEAPMIDAGEDWILVREPDTSRAWLLSGRDEPEPVDIADVWSVHRQPGSSLFWSIGFTDSRGNNMTVTEIDQTGNETGNAFDVTGPFWIATADPNGGVIVYSAPGGTYHVGPEGANRLTTGDLIALGTRKLLATDCGDDLTCGLVVIDRTTGEATPLTPTVLEPTTEGRMPYYENPANYGQPSLMAAVSPDNRYAPVIVTGLDQDYGVIDLTTGEFIQFGDYPESTLWWSQDGTSAMYLVNGNLTVYDFTSRSTYEVSQDVLPLQSFSVRS
jgi:hypothetical protein